MSFVVPQIFASPETLAFFTGWRHNPTNGAFEFPDIRPFVSDPLPPSLQTVVLTRETAPLLVGTIFLAAADLAMRDRLEMDIRRGKKLAVSDVVYDFVGDALRVGLRALITPGTRVELPIDLTIEGVKFLAGFTENRLTVTIQNGKITEQVSINLASGEVKTERCK